MLPTGRMVFGGAILGFGFACLLYVDFLASLQPVPAWVPAYRVLAVANGGLLAGAGLAILIDRKTALASLVVAVIFLSGIALLHVPSTFAQPALLRSPWWIRTFESVAVIAGAITLAGLRDAPARSRWIPYGRIAFGLSIPVFGILHLVYGEPTASLIPPWYPWPLFWAYFTGVAQIAAGLAIATSVWSRPASVLAGTMYGAWALTLHVPRVWCRLQGPCEFLGGPGGYEASRGEITSLFVVIGMCGAAWLVAAGASPRAAPAGPSAESSAG